MKHLKLNKKKSLLGFTIIELLAVIVIIAIVATITLVVYTGITKNAYELSLKSDLSGASETLKTFKATHGSYPATIDCSAGETTTNTCVKSSNGNTYTSYVSTSTTFSLIEKNNPSGLIYIITESTDAMAYVEPVTTVSAVSAGGDHTCAVISNGRAYCWGNNSSGQLGNNSTTSMSTPVAVDISGALNGLTIKYISSGYDHTCAIASDGRVYCWGHNDSGQLGNNSKTNSSTPVAVDTSGALNGLTIKYISAGYSNTCVIASNDRAYCWGYNAWGQLGNNSTTSMSTPVAVDTSGALNGLTIKTISAGIYHTCAIASNGKAYCWGYNTLGELGSGGGSMSYSTPVAVDTSGVLNGLTVNSIGAAFGHTCSIASNNKAYCWGNNNMGELGNNSTTNSSTPVAVDTSGALNGLTVQSVSSSYSYHTCVVASNGKPYCWGYGGKGQLGNNSTSNSLTPVAVDTSGALNGLTVKAISVGTYHTCAIASNNNAYCWGNNDNGQLGNNSTTNSLVPAAVQKTW